MGAIVWGEFELEPEVRDWYLTLNEDQQGRVDFHIDRLAMKGPLLDEPHTNNSVASFESCVSISEVGRRESPTGSHRVVASYC